MTSAATQDTHPALAPPTRWATPPPEGAALTPAERAWLDGADERHRNDPDKAEERNDTVRQAQRERDAAIAARYGQPASPVPLHLLTGLLERHDALLAGPRARVAAAQVVLERARDTRSRAEQLATEKRQVLERLEVAEREAAQRFAAECEAALMTGAVPNPYAGFDAADAATRHRAEIEARGATAAQGSLSDSVNRASAALEAARGELGHAVAAALRKEAEEKLTQYLADRERVQAQLDELRAYRADGNRDFATFEIADDIEVPLPLLHARQQQEQARSRLLPVITYWDEVHRVLTTGELPEAATEEVAA